VAYVAAYAAAFCVAALLTPVCCVGDLCFVPAGGWIGWKAYTEVLMVEVIWCTPYSLMESLFSLTRLWEDKVDGENVRAMNALPPGDERILGHAWQAHVLRFMNNHIDGYHVRFGFGEPREGGPRAQDCHPRDDYDPNAIQLAHNGARIALAVGVARGFMKDCCIKANQRSCRRA